MICTRTIAAALDKVKSRHFSSRKSAFFHGARHRDGGLGPLASSPSGLDWSPAEFLPSPFGKRPNGPPGPNHADSRPDALLIDWDKGRARPCRRSASICLSLELRNPDLATQRIGVGLDRSGLTANRLVIEVLETVVAQAGDDIVRRNLVALRELGCRIDLDDFGTGHASITTLQQFPISRVKIDRSFIKDIDRRNDKAPHVCGDNGNDRRADPRNDWRRCGDIG